ncbi:MAG: putative DNA-binding transcriptional regulator YafY [Chitinophagales bacterium]|jgi:predicted DNA-binding transcriptional regulator YafY
MQNHDNNKDGGRRKMHYSPNLLSCLNNAIENHMLVTIQYDSRENEQTTRQLEPMALVYKNRKRNLAAWCHLREDWRSFRLDRIDMIKLHTQTFDDREGFDVTEFERDDDFDNNQSHQANQNDSSNKESTESTETPSV